MDAAGGRSAEAAADHAAEPPCHASAQPKSPVTLLVLSGVPDDVATLWGACYGSVEARELGVAAAVQRCLSAAAAAARADALEAHAGGECPASVVDRAVARRLRALVAYRHPRLRSTALTTLCRTKRGGCGARGWLAAMAHLLAAGVGADDADWINAQCSATSTDAGGTALHRAVWGERALLAPVVELLRQGARVDIRDKWDRTPLQLAEVWCSGPEREDILSVLQSAEVVGPHAAAQRYLQQHPEVHRRFRAVPSPARRVIIAMYYTATCSRRRSGEGEPDWASRVGNARLWALSRLPQHAFAAALALSLPRVPDD